MAERTDAQDKLNVLSEAYAAQLPEKLKQIEQAWQNLPREVWDEHGFEILHRSVHSLTGSGKTFGFALLSGAARNLEACLKQLAQAKTALDENQRNHVQAMMCELHQAAMHKDAPEMAGLANAARYKQKQAGFQHIVVVEDDLAFAESLKIQLGYFGYDVSIFNNLADFRVAMQANPDVLVLMDINFPEDRLGGVHIMNELQQGRETLIPVIFISVHDAFDVRLEAVHAGGIAYMSKPLNIGNLIDRLDSLASTRPLNPYRVLIVEDLAELAAYYATVLELAGMEVRTVNDPSTVLEPLLEFSPDLILIDIYMPECNGVELARVIRQIDAFVSVPIVFLSVESDLDKQFSAISLGGDDFLNKPIRPEHLVSAVTSRIKRSLMLRSFMVCDSLTGLLNHSTIKDQLEREAARAKRQLTPLSFAMIDIDRFKQVNDTYGHPAGDRVIKSLARLLKQRLRETDMVGRYGGEEFAVILGNTDGEAALNVLDAIREDFSRLRHLAGDKEFTVTFSCGIADNAHSGNAIGLGEAADQALYKAKQAGRNQIVLA